MTLIVNSPCRCHSARYLDKRPIIALLLFATTVAFLTTPARAEGPTAQDVRRLESQIAKKLDAGEFSAAAESASQLLDALQAMFPDDDGGLKGRGTQYIPLIAYSGRLDEAIQRADRFVNTSKEKLGKEHWRTVDARLLRIIVECVAELTNADRIRLAEVERDSRRALVLFRQRKVREATKLLEQAAAARRELLGPESPLYFTELNKLSHTALALGDPAQAFEYAEQALAIAYNIFSQDIAPNGHPELASSQMTVGQLAMTLGNNQRAERALAQALDVRRRLYPVEDFPDGHEKILEVMTLLLKAFMNSGQLIAAETLLAEAFEMSERLDPNNWEQIAILNDIGGHVARGQGRYGVARERVLLALESYQRIQDDEPTQEQMRQQFNCLFTLVDVENGQGNREEAERFAKVAIEWAEKAFPRDRYPHGHFELAQMFSLLGMVQTGLKKFDQAETHHLQAVEMFEQLLQGRTFVKQEGNYARVLVNYANCLKSQRKFTEAIPYFETAVEVLGRKDDRGRLIYTPHRYIAALANLGTSLQETGAPAEEWLGFMRRSFEVAQATFPADKFPHSHPTLLAAQRTLVCGLGIQGEHDEVLELLVDLIENHHDYIVNEMARSHIDSMAMNLTFLELELEWLLTYALVLREEEPRYATLAYQWIASHKSVVIDMLIRSRRQQRQLADDPKVAEAQSHLASAQAEMQAFVLNPPPNATQQALEEERLELEARVRFAETELMVALAQRAGDVSSGPIDLAKLRGNLDEYGGDAIVDIVAIKPVDLRFTDVRQMRRFRARYLAFVVRPENQGEVALIDLGNCEDIDRVIGQLRDHMRRVPRSLRIQSEGEILAEYRELATALYRLAVKPLAAELGDAETIFVAPDGELNRVAFETLTDEEGRFLIAGHSFAYLSSSSDFLRPAAEPGEGAVVFANPDFDLNHDQRDSQLAALIGDDADSSTPMFRSVLDDATRGLTWKELPGTAKEAELITQLLADARFGAVKTYTSAEALEELLKRVHRPRLLHLATHGYYLPVPEGDLGPVDLVRESDQLAAPRTLGRLRREDNPLYRSGIVLSGANSGGDESSDDGWVTAEEVAMLDLEGTELVVLSACETGLADVRTGENVSGLRRAFLHAGARSLVSSLFKVPDLATHELMTEFYANLRDQDPCDALHEAQRAFIAAREKQYGAAHPFFWGGFVFVGVPQP